ncbi:MAG TPA: XRE family transcriptional regulator [Candidatus Methylacidiphilales bacterium]|nr:XRE family transcriptional regulator [Candidatus Methylacidiphilales bacterium]
MTLWFTFHGFCAFVVMDFAYSYPEDFAERLRLWRTGKRMTQAEAAHMLGINRSYLSQVESGRAPGRALRDRFLLAEKSAPAKLKESAGRYGLRNLPILSWAQAGQATDFEEIPSDWDETVPSDVTDELAFGVRLRGDSMEPKFSDGDIAILLPNTPATNGDIVVANIKDQGAVCKIMHVQLDKHLITLSSYNPAYPPMEYHRDDFHWIFPAATVIKQLQRR